MLDLTELSEKQTIKGRKGGGIRVWVFALSHCRQANINQLILVVARISYVKCPGNRPCFGMPNNNCGRDLEIDYISMIRSVCTIMY